MQEKAGRVPYAATTHDRLFDSAERRIPPSRTQRLVNESEARHGFDAAHHTALGGARQKATVPPRAMVDKGTKRDAHMSQARDEGMRTVLGQDNRLPQGRTGPHPRRASGGDQADWMAATLVVPIMVAIGTMFLPLCGCAKEQALI